MIPKAEDEKLIRRYLLGELTEDERRQIEARVFDDDEFAERFPDQLSVVEDELIEDYVKGVLTLQEERHFDEHFLSSVRRRKKLAFVKSMSRYATRADKSGREGQFFTFPGWAALPFAQSWKFAVYAVLILGAGIGVWRAFFYRSAADRASAALSQAYGKQRPVEPRITGFGYAPYRFSAQRSERQEQVVDYVALDQAKNILFSKGDVSSDSSMSHALGKFYLTQKEFDNAIDQFRKALSLTPNDVRLHSDLGAALLARTERDRLTQAGRSKEDVDECFEHLNKALALEASALEALFNRAMLNQRELLRREAREDWKKYLELDRDSPWAEEAKQNLRTVEEELKKVALRREHLYQDFLLAQQTMDQSQALQSFSLSYSFNGNYIIEKLVDGFLEAKLAGRWNEAEERLRALFSIGKLSEEKTGDRFTLDLARYYKQARPGQLLLAKQGREMMTRAYRLYQDSLNDQAIEKYEQARQLFAQIGNHCEELFAEAWIGHCHHQRSDTDNNLRVFTYLAPACAKRKYRWMEANALCGLANAHNSSGLFSHAIDDCLRCGMVSEELGDHAGVLRSKNMLAYYYYELGRHEESLRVSQSGRNLADRISADIRYAVPFYNYAAWSLSAVGLHEAALAFQSEAVRMAEETGSPRLTAYAYIYRGQVLAKCGKYDEAIASAQRGIAIGRKLKDDATGQDFLHTGLLHLGHIYRQAKKFSEALDAFDRVINFFRLSKKQIYLYGASKGRLLTLIAQGNSADTREELDRVIALYEKYRKRIKEESNRNSFFDQEQGIYDVAIDFAYYGLDDEQRAFEYSELSRARSLLDESRRGWEMIAGLEVPDLRIAAATQPVGLNAIQQDMPDRAQIVEYAALEDKLIIWRIVKNGIQSRVVNIPLAALSERINQFLELVDQPPGIDDQRWREYGAELHDILIRPIEALLDTEKQLCIIPDKILYRLPYSALVSRASGRLLIEDFPLIYASSANLYLHSTAKAREKAGVTNEQLLAVGNPSFDRTAFPKLDDLRSAAEEVSEIAAYYPSRVALIGPQAEKSAVLREIERADVVHLAMHYVPDHISPMFSKLPLASVPGGTGRHADRESALQMHELYRLRSALPRLAVFSACQTRAEEYLRGEGAIGISRPLEAAGVPLVIASLWPVDSSATSTLMTAFHRERKRNGLPTVQALRAAQIEMLGKETRYRHPYYWAAFIASGGYSDF